LRGIVRAQGWAEAEKAKAQRNPAAMREHEQIFGQAPRQGILFNKKSFASPIRPEFSAKMRAASNKDPASS
jgi:hypothetical protein